VRTKAQDQQAALRDAVDWVLRIEEEPSLITSEDFERWLHAGPHHRKAFTQAANTWGEAGELPLGDLLRDEGMPVSESAPARHRSIRRPVLWGSMGAALSVCAAAVFVAAFLLPSTSSPGWQANYQTQTAQIETYELVDGTSMSLDAQSVVFAHIDDEYRTLELAQGRLFVDVERDEDKPFRVVADDMTFTALGTSYSVERLSDGWQLEVYEGQVSADGPERNQSLTANQGLIVRDGQAELFDLAETLESEVPDWTSKRLVLNSVSVADAIKKFERYSVDEIVVDDESLKTFRVSGVFRLTEPDAFVKTVSQLTGSRVIHSDGRLILTHSE
tara:strand:+ start:4735 stop:5727 length:993 start_codon:yes stop_codon:yes gene_type:complete